MKKNDQRNRKFFEKQIWSKSIQNGTKLILKRKYRFRKFYPLKIFFRDITFPTTINFDDLRLCLGVKDGNEGTDPSWAKTNFSWSVGNGSTIFDFDT